MRNLFYLFLRKITKKISAIVLISKFKLQSPQNSFFWRIRGFHDIDNTVGFATSVYSDGGIAAVQ